MNFKSVDEILNYAIDKEEDARQFYLDIAAKMDRPYMKQVFEQFAKEEKGHKAKLQAVKEGKMMLKAEKKVIDLQIGDHLEEVDMDSKLDYQQALIVAMKAEKNSYRLYNDLANSTDDENLSTMFLSLAQEEAKHKLRFEIEYDEYVLREN